ncbi:MAG: gfo/Idh/MocA family oxidoreductase [Marivirga sp.]|nr:gfo/Idh/MocA family oxidoreductase [Marivirga sp.]
MLKIGIIGLGDIAQKAYLPVIGKRNIEVHLFTRNDDTLSRISELYRFKNIHHSIESLIASGIKGAFVHTSTSSHEAIIDQLLSNNIHVYVDKPITYDYKSSEKLLIKAGQRNLILMVGFNRRYAPSSQLLKELSDPNMILMQKNRRSLPGDVRTFIFDDFIHVVDTLLYLFPYTIDNLIINGRKKGDQLFHVTVQFVSAEGATAIGIMNRDSGTAEERIEVFTSQEKRVAHNMNDVFVHQNKNETRLPMDDWGTTLHKRGFEQIIDEFLHAVQSGIVSPVAKSNILMSHKICEQVVEKLSNLR